VRLPAALKKYYGRLPGTLFAVALIDASIAQGGGGFLINCLFGLGGLIVLAAARC
jgi:hypothetical protein